MNETHRTKVGEQGRVVIPASLRKEMGIRPGDEILLQASDEGIRICTLQQAARRFQEEIQQLVGHDRSLSE